MHISASSSIFSNNYIPTLSGGFTNEKSLLFDGVDEYVDCGAVSELDTPTEISLSFWVKINDTRSDTFCGARVLSTSRYLWVYRTSSNVLKVRCWGADVSTGVTLTTGWHHIVVTAKAGNTAYCYIDDSQYSLGTRTPNNVTNAFYIGKVLNGTPTTSNIDEVAIFDYEMSAVQITALYNAGEPTNLNNTSGVTPPVHWWRLGDNDIYPTITDVGTIGGNNGTMINMEIGDIVTDTP